MRVSVLISLLALPAVAGAEEKAAPAASPPVEAVDSISAARREFDALKSARDPVTGQPRSSPTVTMPELQTGLGGPLWDTGAKKKLDPSNQKSKNWLIEAMEKDRQLDAGQRRDGRHWTETDTERLLKQRDELKPAREAGSENETLLALAREGEAADAKKEARAGDERPPNVVNPLAGFMSDWMTPKDFALLQPNQSAGAGKDSGGAVDAAGAMGASGFGLGPVGASAGPATGAGVEPLGLGLLGGGNRSAPIAGPRENPYLPSALPGGPATELVFSPPPPTMPAPNPTGPTIFAPVAPPSEPAPARSKIPEFAKPPTDDKYFKQLKRF